jgi:uncharacterized membrane-anchored protein
MKRLPPITLGYWIMIISANTIGESGGDLISQTFGLGYGASTIALIGLFILAALVAVMTRSQHPAIYWTVIILSSTAGTTMSDYVTRTLGLGYGWGTLAILATMAVIFAAWRWVAPRQHIDDPLNPATESLYWAAILTSSTLGTAFGDFISNGTPLGFGGGTIVLVAALALIAALWAFTPLSRDVCYWLAIVVTHPLGATMGDYLTKEEGFDLGNFKATVILSAVFLAIVVARFAATRRTQLPASL